MKAFFLLTGCWLLSLTDLAAQDSRPIRIKAGTDARVALPVQERYRYPTFQNGNLVYHHGTVSAGRFNYNLLLGEMQFIDPKGDTLSLAAESTIKVIAIGKDQFFFVPEYGYLEQLADYPAVRLIRKQFMKIGGTEKVGAYDQSSGVSAITSYNTYSTNGQLYKLQPRGDFLLNRETAYFFGDANNRYYKATRSNLLKIFPKHKRAIEAYLKEQAIQFNKPDDLDKALRFSSGLL